MGNLNLGKFFLCEITCMWINLRSGLNFHFQALDSKMEAHQIHHPSCSQAHTPRLHMHFLHHQRCHWQECYGILEKLQLYRLYHFCEESHGGNDTRQLFCAVPWQQQTNTLQYNSSWPMKEAAIYVAMMMKKEPACWDIRKFSVSGGRALEKLFQYYPSLEWSIFFI